MQAQRHNCVLNVFSLAIVKRGGGELRIEEKIREDCGLRDLGWRGGFDKVCGEEIPCGLEEDKKDLSACA